MFPWRAKELKDKAAVNRVGAVMSRVKDVFAQNRDGGVLLYSVLHTLPRWPPCDVVLPKPIPANHLLIVSLAPGKEGL